MTIPPFPMVKKIFLPKKWTSYPKIPLRSFPTRLEYEEWRVEAIESLKKIQDKCPESGMNELIKEFLLVLGGDEKHE